MSGRIVQNMVMEYVCDECGKNRRSESHPEHWASVTVDSFLSVGGRVAKRLDLCAECITLDKYAWTVA